MNSTTPVSPLVVEWNISDVGLSYLISVTGSYCTIQLMEQWRITQDKRLKFRLLVASSVALGGCGIWAMHYTGMKALVLRLPHQTNALQIDYDACLTILSWVFAVLAILTGLMIASRDTFFETVNTAQRREKLANGMKEVSITTLKNKKAAARALMKAALFSNLHCIFLGGVCAAGGVLLMHYTGMSAQVTQSKMVWSSWIIALSCVIAIVTASAAFWILFRVLTFWPNKEVLRIGSALVMGIAVCGTHYTGMYAADCIYVTEMPEVRFKFDGETSTHFASHLSLVLCYLLSSKFVLSDLRRQMHYTAATCTAGTSLKNPDEIKSENASDSSINHTRVTPLREEAIAEE